MVKFYVFDKNPYIDSGNNPHGERAKALPSMLKDIKYITPSEKEETDEELAKTLFLKYLSGLCLVEELKDNCLLIKRYYVNDSGYVYSFWLQINSESPFKETDWCNGVKCLSEDIMNALRKGTAVSV